MRETEERLIVGVEALGNLRGLRDGLVATGSARPFRGPAVSGQGAPGGCCGTVGRPPCHRACRRLYFTSVHEWPGREAFEAAFSPMGRDPAETDDYPARHEATSTPTRYRAK